MNDYASKKIEEILKKCTDFDLKPIIYDAFYAGRQSMYNELELRVRAMQDLLDADKEKKEKVDE